MLQKQGIYVGLKNDSIQVEEYNTQSDRNHYTNKAQAQRNQNIQLAQPRKMQLSNSLRSFQQMIHEKFQASPEVRQKLVKPKIQSENKKGKRNQDYGQEISLRLDEFTSHYEQPASQKSRKRDTSSQSRKFLEKLQETRVKIQSQLSQLDKQDKLSSQNSSPNQQLKSAIQVKNEDIRQIRGLKQSVQFNIPDFEIDNNTNIQNQSLFQDRRYSHQPQIQKQKVEEQLRIQSSNTSIGFQNQNNFSSPKTENIDDLNERIKQLELENQKHKEMLERLQSKIILQTPTNFQKELSPIRQQQDELFSSIFSTNNLENEDDIYNRLLQSKSNSKQNSTKNLVSMLQSHTQPISNSQAQEIKYNIEYNQIHHNLEVQKVESQDTPSFTRANTQQDHHLKNVQKWKQTKRQRNWTLLQSRSIAARSCLQSQKAKLSRKMGQEIIVITSINLRQRKSQYLIKLSMQVKRELIIDNCQTQIKRIVPISLKEKNNRQI
eukprot:403350556